ncbi:flavin reductase family protein [Amycolatopsis sp.]|jgi:flavin reductase (DIM6/NTAB) family NADH-FMN oxidoreductase RutF|uniref:flavin reductase family protein n=1 Tax=Amycolatopsis sp. TaxID=37632 RepID=UPI002E0948BC|nr:flavin reductase family protein [Amycolatopsis sp.]
MEPPERPVLKRLPAPSARRLSEQGGLREVMARFATGITVLTAGGEQGHGMTANAFSSVSLDPPMVLCCVSRAARMHSAIVAAGSFGVSILGAEQNELARYFADWRRPGGLAQFDEVDWSAGPQTGAPLLDGALAWLECRLAHSYEGGDHSIFVGEVVTADRGQVQDALVFYGGGYHQVGPRARATA